MFSEALNLTLEHYKIPAKELSQRSGVAEAIISDFRRGKTLPRIDTIERLINALPQEAKNYMLFSGFLSKLTDKDLSLLLHLIANELRSSDTEVNEVNTTSDRKRRETKEYQLVVA